MAADDQFYIDPTLPRGGSSTRVNLPAEAAPLPATIRPFSPRLFARVANDPMLSNTARDAIVNRALEGRLKLEDARHKIVSYRQQETLNSVRIDRERFLLEEARRKSRREQEAFQGAGAISGEIEAVLNNPELDNDQKVDALGALRSRHAGTIVQSPTARELFNAGMSRLDPKLTAQQREDLKRRDEIDAQRKAAAEADAQRRARSAASSELEVREAELGDDLKLVNDLAFAKETDPEKIGGATGDVFTESFEDEGMRAALDEIATKVASDLGDRELYDLYQAATTDKARRELVQQGLAKLRTRIQMERRKFGPAHLNRSPSSTKAAGVTQIPIE